MKHRTQITVLVENTVSRRGLLAEHGLSFWIERGESCVLFDTGQTDILVHNAQVLGIDLTRTDAIVLSHGHYDHSGGLGRVLELAPRARVFLHPDALGPKFSRHSDGKCYDLSLPRLAEAAVRRRTPGLGFTERPTEVSEGLFVSGPIPRRNSFEDSGGAFFRDAECTDPDPLNDDQALYFECSKGTVVLLGCAHAGLVNTINHVRTAAGGQSLHAVVGGMHLGSASEARLIATLDVLQSHEELLLAPAHCTGTWQKMLLWHRFPGRCRECIVGSQFSFE